MTLSLPSERPGFADTLAHRGWHARWTESGRPPSADHAHPDPMTQGTGLPFALVAHDGDAHRASVLVIESDLDARPQHSPWIAALWVEPAPRRQGHASRLLQAARARAAALGHPRAHLAATPDKAPVCLARGLQRVEWHTDGLDLFRT